MDKQTKEYLVKRQVALLGDQHAFEEMKRQHGTDEENLLYSNEDITRIVHETKARLAELGLMVTCAQAEHQHQQMTKREDLQRQLDRALEVCEEVNENTALGQGAREARDTLTARLEDLNNR